MSWVATAIVASAVVIGGTSYYQGEKQRSTIKKAQADMEAKNAKALKEAQLAQDTAESQAKEQTKEKRRRMANSNTIFTGPMGLSDQAQYVRKTLTGQ